VGDEAAYLAFIDEVLTIVAYKILNQANKNIDDYKINDTGRLRGSGVVEPAGEEYLIVWKAPYSGAIEFGSHPHMVPAEVLYGWVRRKMRISDDRRAWGIAYAIQKEIAESGQTGRHFIRDAIDMMAANP
jgi:hypothetical protein